MIILGILDQVSDERRREGVRVVIAGQEKMGKTTLTCSAPSPLLVPLEVGYGGVQIHKTPMLKTFDEVENLVYEITESCKSGKFPYKTVIFDSATALERLIHGKVVSIDLSHSKGGVTMDSALGGFGKAYSCANDMFSRFLNNCDQLAVYGGINIVLTCHVFASTIVDPTAGEYDCWDLLLHSPKNNKTYGKRELICQWADIVGFLYEPMYVSKSDTLNKGITANKGRVLGVSRTPSYVAGNRFSCTGEITIPKEGGWSSLAEAINQSANSSIFDN